MENKREIKVKLSTVIAIFEFIIILALLIGVCYLISTNRVSIVKNEKEKQQINNMENTEKVPLTNGGTSTENSLPTEEAKQEVKENSIPDNDLYAQGNEYFVFIENGTAYYKYSKKYGEFQADQGLKNIIKLDENVKRVKLFNLGTDISDTVFLILEDGTVKSISRNSELKQFDLLKDYEVEDIISVEGTYYPGNEIKYKVLLKDGTIKEIVDKV